jgi:hypothetical protein
MACLRSLGRDLAAADVVLGSGKTGIHARASREQINHRGVHFALGERVVPTVAEQPVASNAGVEVVVARSTEYLVVTILLIAEVQDIDTGAAANQVIAIDAGDEVTAVSSRQAVVSGAAVDNIASIVATDEVVTLAGEDDVAPAEPDDHIAPRGALDPFTPPISEDGGRPPEAGGFPGQRDRRHERERRDTHDDDSGQPSEGGLVRP